MPLLEEQVKVTMTLAEAWEIQKLVKDQRSQIDTLAKQVAKLRKAIGVSVPTCLRVLLTQLPADAEADREIAEKVLSRVNAAMDETDPPLEAQT